MPVEYEVVKVYLGKEELVGTYPNTSEAQDHMLFFPTLVMPGGYLTDTPLIGYKMYEIEKNEKGEIVRRKVILEKYLSKDFIERHRGFTLQ